MHRRETLATLACVLAVAGLLIVPGASAQTDAGPDGGAGAPVARGTDLQTTAPLRGGPLDEERVRGAGPRPHEPMFLGPAVVTTESAQLGLSSWVTPGAPLDHREDPGGVAIGLTIGWPGPRRDVPSTGPNPWRGSAAR
jgi:hypothetical protein